MKLKLLKTLLLFLLLAVAVRSKAQIILQFIPAINEQTVNGLFAVQVQNTTALIYKGKVKIRVSDVNNRIVLLATTPVILIKPGTNLIQASASQSRLQFGASPAGNLASQTGHFPPGEYEYCFEFTGGFSKAGADEQVFENCFHYAAEPVIPLSLVYPAPGDQICNTRPDFNWQPAMPLVSNYQYRIVVTEKETSQSGVDALTNNTPVFQQDNIRGFMLLYPPQVQELQKGKEYVWQVAAYEGSTRITQSEIWTFNVNCNDRKPPNEKESYRQLSGYLNGNYYISGSILHFTIINPYGSSNIKYSITDIADPARQISNLPELKMQTGLNKIDMPLEDVHNLQANKRYLLTIKNIGDHTQYLQFIYKEDEVL